MDDISDLFLWFFSILGMVLITVGISGGVYCIFKSAASDGRIQYCYVTSDSQRGTPLYSLHGFRPWCPDTFLGTYPTLSATVEAADKISCPVRVK